MSFLRRIAAADALPRALSARSRPLMWLWVKDRERQARWAAEMNLTRLPGTDNDENKQ